MDTRSVRHRIDRGSDLEVAVPDYREQERLDRIERYVATTYTLLNKGEK